MFDVGDQVVVACSTSPFFGITGVVESVELGFDAHWVTVNLPERGIYSFAWDQVKKTNPPKRFLLFSGSEYYACGGWKDLVGSYERLNEAIDVGQGRVTTGQGTEYGHPDDWYLVVDLYSGLEVAKHGRAYGWDYE